MKRAFLSAIAAAAACSLAALAGPANAQAPMPPPPAPPPGVKVGMLGCTLSPTIGLILGSLQKMDCRFTPDNGLPPEIYTGTYGTLGIDLGFTAAQGLAWGVYAPTNGPVPGALAGTYVGPSAEVSAGLGVGANVLFGGSQRSIALQPLSLSGDAGINVSAGISTIELRWVP